MIAEHEFSLSNSCNQGQSMESNTSFLAKDSETGAMTHGRLYDFSTVKVGDGMFFDSLEKAKAVIAAAYHYAKKSNPEFKLSRKSIHGGYRVWRSK